MASLNIGTYEKVSISNSPEFPGIFGPKIGPNSEIIGRVFSVILSLINRKKPVKIGYF